MDKEFLKEIKDYIEDVEHKIEWEFGACRDLEEIIKDGDMPELYYKICKLLED